MLRNMRRNDESIKIWKTSEKVETCYVRFKRNLKKVTNWEKFGKVLREVMNSTEFWKILEKNYKLQRIFWEVLKMNYEEFRKISTKNS